MPAARTAAPQPGAVGPAPGRGVAGALFRWPDSRVEPLLAVVSCLVLVLIVGMVAFVFEQAWPSFWNNGIDWFGSGGLVDRQFEDIYNSGPNPDQYEYTIHAWPLIWATILTTGGAVIWGIALSVFAAIFVVEFAPAWMNRILEPAVRLLGAVPSVVYGLIGLLVIVPFVGDHLISQDRAKSVANVIQLTGASIGVGTLILTVMITPIMTAIVVDALRAVPRGWTEGAAALGVNRWRVIWTIAVRTSRPAIIAAAVLATARALGEAIMLSMVSGSTSFAPNPIDGLTFFFEPARPLAAAIVDNAEGLSVVPLGQTIYAFAALLLISSMFMSLAGYVAKLPMRKYGIRP